MWFYSVIIREIMHFGYRICFCPIKISLIYYYPIPFAWLLGGFNSLRLFFFFKSIIFFSYITFHRIGVIICFFWLVFFFFFFLFFFWNVSDFFFFLFDTLRNIRSPFNYGIIHFFGKIHEISRFKSKCNGFIRRIFNSEDEMDWFIQVFFFE